MTTAWIALIVAGLFEIVWAIGLKYADGFTRLIPSLVTIIFAFASFYLLAYAMKEIPMGTAYAAWVGIGAVGTVILGMLLFHEDASFIKIFFLCLVIVGIIGLKFFVKE